MQTVERFTAWCPCPSCDYVACHLWREPKPAPTLADVKAYQARRAEAIEDNGVETSTISTFGGTVVRVDEFIPGFTESEPVDRESNFEVIRICRCGHEWGQG